MHTCLLVSTLDNNIIVTINPGCVADILTTTTTTTAYDQQNGDFNEKPAGRKLCPPMENVPQPINRVNTSTILQE